MRRVARENVFKLVFEYTFYHVANDGTLDLLLVGSDINDDDRDYISSTYLGIVTREKELNMIIEAHTDKYRLDRIYRPDYAVLLLATYELLEHTAPDAVVINEAVDLAKKYGTDKSGSFVNGVLAKIVKDVK